MRLEGDTPRADGATSRSVLNEGMAAAGALDVEPIGGDELRARSGGR